MSPKPTPVEPGPARLGLPLAAVMVAATGFSWGFIIVKALGLPPAVIGFWRLLIGGVALSAVALVLRVPWPRSWGAVVGAGVCFGAHQLLFIAASQLTSIAIVTLLAALQPLLVALVSRRLLGEPVPRLLWVSALLAVGAVGVVVLANLEAPSRSLTGDLLAVLNLLAFTSFFLFSKRARMEGAPTLTLTSSSLCIGLLVALPMLPFASALPREPGQWGLLLFLALVPGNGHLLINWAHSRVPATLVSIVLAAMPILSSLWAHLIFDEPYGLAHLIGMAMTVLAVELGRRAEVRAPVGQPLASVER